MNQGKKHIEYVGGRGNGEKSEGNVMTKYCEGI